MPVRLPVLEGKPILVRLQPELTAFRGKLLSRETLGTPVHAGSFIRKRIVFLDRELIRQPAELERILVHEIHHFIWVRMGNSARASFEKLVSAEVSRGELGWSAETLRNGLAAGDRARRSVRWRVYLCESFCDTGAWYYASRRKHAEWTLPQKWRDKRALWFKESFEGRIVSI